MSEVDDTIARVQQHNREIISIYEKNILEALKQIEISTGLIAEMVHIQSDDARRPAGVSIDLRAPKEGQ